MIIIRRFVLSNVCAYWNARPAKVLSKQNAYHRHCVPQIFLNVLKRTCHICHTTRTVCADRLFYPYFGVLNLTQSVTNASSGTSIQHVNPVTAARAKTVTKVTRACIVCAILRLCLTLSQMPTGEIKLVKRRYNVWVPTKPTPVSGPAIQQLIQCQKF